MMIQQTAKIPASRHLDVSLPETFAPGTQVVYTITIRKVQETPNAVPDDRPADDAFGLWKDRDVTLESIRAKAWGIGDVSL
jgi:hypothetical protein